MDFHHITTSHNENVIQSGMNTIECESYTHQAVIPSFPNPLFIIKSKWNQMKYDCKIPHKLNSNKFHTKQLSIIPIFTNRIPRINSKDGIPCTEHTEHLPSQWQHSVKTIQKEKQWENVRNNRRNIPSSISVEYRT